MNPARPRIITAGRVITPFGDLTPGTVEVAGGRFTAVRAGPTPSADLSAPDGILAAGFIDLQINGAAGVDFLSYRADADLTRLRQYLASTGVTSFLPTLITSPISRLQQVLQQWHRASQSPERPRILGVHLEGPYLSAQFPGAHPRRYLQLPDAKQAAALLNIAPSFVRLMTLAPELSGAGKLIQTLRDHGCMVAAGHTAATFDQAQAAFAAGVTLVTHLFNAMRPVHQRDPGIIVAALQHRQMSVSLITDFVHVHPAMLQLAVRLKGWERVALITDAIAAAGAGRRVTRLGARTVRVTDVPRLPDGTIAGSVLSMDRAVRNVVSLGVPLREAVLMASAVPARLLGRDDLGQISIGATADFVVLSPKLEVIATYVGGERIYGDR